MLDPSYPMTRLLTFAKVTTTAGTAIYGMPSPEQRLMHTLPKRASYRVIAQAGNGKVTSTSSCLQLGGLCC